MGKWNFCILERWCSWYSAEQGDRRVEGAISGEGAEPAKTTLVDGRFGSRGVKRQNDARSGSGGQEGKKGAGKHKHLLIHGYSQQRCFNL